MNAENEEEVILVTEWEKKEDVINVEREDINKEIVLDLKVVHQDLDLDQVHIQAEVHQEDEEDVMERIEREGRNESIEALDLYLKVAQDHHLVIKRVEVEARMQRVDLALK